MNKMDGAARSTRISPPMLRRLGKHQRIIATIVIILAGFSLLASMSLTSSLSNPDTRVPLASSNNERYLAYLPHSGLSNQRIELANALVLAALLDRTLVVPPAFLGTVVGWMKQEQLYEHLGWLTDDSVDFEYECRPATPGDLGSYVVKSRCIEYHRFAVIHWTTLHDLEHAVAPYVRIRFQDQVSLEKLQDDLGIGPEETYVHMDEHIYDWRLYEDRAEAKRLITTGTNYFDSFAGRRYFKVYTLDYWRRRPEKLLQLGGIFGSTRMSLVNPQHLALRERITQALHYRRDTPIGETAQNIVRYLGGEGSFVGVHFRTGDSPFRKQLRHNMDMFAQGMAELTQANISLPISESKSIIYQDDDSIDEEKRIQLLPPYEGLHRPPWSTICHPVPADKNAPITLGTSTNIYIATDHRDPRGANSQLLPWFNTFPCTVTLNDLPEYLFAPLDRLHDHIVPGKPLRSFLIPIVDAMVAAHARQVFTTPRSTYSRYISEMNQAWIH